MTDRPILFSGPMVRALLDGRKTQTRRIFKLQPPTWVNFCQEVQNFNVRQEWVPAGLWWWTKTDETGQLALRRWPVDEYGQRYALRPPFARRDRLWVRETVACGACASGRPSHWAPSFWRREQGTPANPNGLWYRADDLAPDRLITDRGRWVPGIHMPRWASRLTLSITDVRVERLQDISEADAIVEGIERDPETGAWWGADGQGVGGATRLYAHAEHAYRDLWDHLNEARGYGWDANPWVVAVSFEVQHRNIDAPRAQEAA